MYLDMYLDVSDVYPKMYLGLVVWDVKYYDSLEL